MDKPKYKIKIGARVLSEEQLNKVLPNNGEIFRRIEIIRNQAKSYRESYRKNESNDTSYNKYLKKELDTSYDNVFSILGDRGSGKTSVLLTIKSKLTNENPNDIMLPLIIPENMGKASDTLGWTICAFEKVINDIEEVIYKEGYTEETEKLGFYKNCRKIDKNSLRKSFNELLKYYTFVNEDYRGILNNNYDGLNEYRDKTKEIVNAERELLSKFDEFISILVKTKKYLNASKEEPLVYLFFDDVDLNTERCLEIVNMILKYLSNPNIVVFVTGNYATFSEAITINLLEKDNILRNTDEYFYKSREEGGINALETRKILTQDILKKALPPADRFYMPELTNKEKAEFIYDIKDNDEYCNLAELINKKLLNIKRESYKESFFYNNNKLIDIYFTIFDKNPRGLMNVYYFLYSLKRSDYMENRRVSSEVEINKFSRTLKELLNVIIDSNPELVVMREVINNVINIKENLEETFINYEYIDTLFNESDKKSVNNYMKIFILAHFIENIISNIFNSRGVHGIENFVEKVNLSYNYNFIPKINDSKLVLAFYSEFKNNLEGISGKKLNGYDINYFTKKYLEILFSLVKDRRELITILNRINVYDPLWVEMIISVIMESDCTEKEKIVKACNELNRSMKLDKLNNELKASIQKDLKNIRDRGNVNANGDFPESYLEPISYLREIDNISIRRHMSDISLKREKLLINENNLRAEFLNAQDVRYRIPHVFIKNLMNIESNLRKESNNHKNEKNIKNIKKINEFTRQCRINNEVSENDIKSIEKVIREIRESAMIYESRMRYEDFNYLYRILKDLEPIAYISEKSSNIEIIKRLIRENILLRIDIYNLIRKKGYKLNDMKSILMECEKESGIRKIINEKKSMMTKLWFEVNRNVQ